MVTGRGIWIKIENKYIMDYSHGEGKNNQEGRLGLILASTSAGQIDDNHEII